MPAQIVSAPVPADERAGEKLARFASRGSQPHNSQCEKVAVPGMAIRFLTELFYYILRARELLLEKLPPPSSARHRNLFVVGMSELMLIPFRIKRLISRSRKASRRAATLAVLVALACLALWLGFRSPLSGTGSIDSARVPSPPPSPAPSDKSSDSSPQNSDSGGSVNQVRTAQNPPPPDDSAQDYSPPVSDSSSLPSTSARSDEGAKWEEGQKQYWDSVAKQNAWEAGDNGALDRLNAGEATAEDKSKYGGE